MELFFTSDTHFGSQVTLERSRRPFSSTVEMDEMIIERWNNKVGKEDLVLHLGDVGNLETVKRLNGRKYLLEGNHERDRLNTGEYTKDMLLSVFDHVDSDLFYYKELGGRTFKMMHEPYNMSADAINLFGHIHELQMVKKVGVALGLNVGMDCHHFQVLSLDEVLHFVSRMEQFYDEAVYM